MIIGEVIGHVWATKKENSLSGIKLMVVRELREDFSPTDHVFAAGDVVGAGIGERVLTVSGSTARKAFGRDEVAMDTAIVAIIDDLDT